MIDNQLGFDLHGGAQAPPESRPAIGGKWEPDGQGTLYLKTSDGYEAAIWKVDKDKVVSGNHWKINIMSPDGRVVLDGLDPPRTQTRSDAKDYSIGRINFDKACIANPIYRTATRKED